MWCHWCHVIDRESYENSEIAKIINEHFVAVKVDRDERPDVDSRYQSAISAISGQGGWPLTGFLCCRTASHFSAAPIFRPKIKWAGPDFAACCWPWRIPSGTSAPSCERAAESLSRSRGASRNVHRAPAEFDLASSTRRSVRSPNYSISGTADSAARRNFRTASAIDLILERYQQNRKQRKHLLAMAETTLEKMARGGVYDQLAGGFHRYSVDERWLVPHFEKMSYDNSELLKNYLHGCQVTQNPFLRQTAEGIIGWVNEVLSDQEHGGFYASQDADYSLDDDGDYFTWTLDEVRDALSAGRSARHRALLRRRSARRNAPQSRRKMFCGSRANPKKSPRQLGLRRNRSFALTIAQARKKKCWRRACRARRRLLTRRCMSRWNAMFVSAYLRSWREFFRMRSGEDCRAFALKTLDRMLSEAWSERADSRIASAVRRWTARSTIKFSACWRCSTLTKPRSIGNIFARRKKLWTLAIAQYGDTEGGGFFDRASDAPPMGGLDVRRKPFQDSPTPGANSVAAIALIRMHSFTGRRQVSSLGAEDTGSIRRNCSAVWHVRGNVRSGGDAVRASSPASGDYRGSERLRRERAGACREYHISSWKISVAPSAWHGRPGFTSGSVTRNFAALAERQTARSGLCRQYLFPTDRGTRGIEVLVVGQTKYRSSRLAKPLRALQLFLPLKYERFQKRSLASCMLDRKFLQLLCFRR